MRTIEEIMADMSAIMDGAAGRALTAEEVTAYEAFEVELQARQASNVIAARHAAYQTNVIPAGVPVPGGPRRESEMDGFRNYMLTGKLNADIQNAQGEGVGSEGGALVPDGFRQKLIEKLKSYGGIGGIAERYTTGDGTPVSWPTIDDTGNVGEIVQEHGAFTGGADLVFGENDLGAYTYMVGGGSQEPIRVSRELIQDAAFDIEGLLSRLLAERIARIQAVHWATGSGSGEPLGLTTGLTPVQAAANTGFVTDDFIEWEHALDPAYREGARWVFADSTLKTAKKLKDSHGDNLYRGVGQNMAVGFQESTFLGYPITIDQAMPAYVANDSTKLAIAFGQISRGYVIRDVKAFELLVNPYNRMKNRQVEFTGYARADATQQDTSAYIIGSGKS